MKSVELTLARIGNSRGIRLPAELIRKHGLEEGMILEDRGHEIVLTSKVGNTKLSWVETAREMAEANEDWTDWETASSDGLDQIPWEPAAPSKAKPKSRTPMALKR